MKATTTTTPPSGTTVHCTFLTIFQPLPANAIRCMQMSSGSREKTPVQSSIKASNSAEKQTVWQVCTYRLTRKGNLEASAAAIAVAVAIGTARHRKWLVDEEESRRLPIGMHWFSDYRETYSNDLTASEICVRLTDSSIVHTFTEVDRLLALHWGVRTFYFIYYCNVRHCCCCCWFDEHSSLL